MLKKLDCLLKLISNRIPRKTRFFDLARPSYLINRKSAQPLFVKLKLIKMNYWMSQLSNDTKLSMLWTKFDFHIQVDLFMELPHSKWSMGSFTKTIFVIYLCFYIPSVDESEISRDFRFYVTVLFRNLHILTTLLLVHNVTPNCRCNHPITRFTTAGNIFLINEVFFKIRKNLVIYHKKRAFSLFLYCTYIHVSNLPSLNVKVKKDGKVLNFTKVGFMQQFV